MPDGLYSTRSNNAWIMSTFSVSVAPARPVSRSAVVIFSAIIEHHTRIGHPKHGLLVLDLLRSVFAVYALNPKAVNRYKDRLRSSTSNNEYHALADVERVTPEQFNRFVKQHRYSVPGKSQEVLRQLTWRMRQADPVAIVAVKTIIYCL